jgi:hypothetical protein
MENSENTEKIENLIPQKLKPRRGIWLVLGIVLILIGGGSGWFAGSNAGMNIRNQEQQKAVLEIAATQFDLGVRELEEEKFDNARKRFEYVIQLMPGFPGVQEKLTEVMLKMALVSTPTSVPLPTLTPTPDLRGEEELFLNVINEINNEEWETALVTLDTLRQLNLNYHTIDVDGLYYLTLRNRGVQRILAQGNLEPGIYDLALAERFGPLDIEADSYRTWARYYISGASFWGVDWSQVVSIFGQIYPAFPNMYDSTGLTAKERYRVALIKWGDQLALKEDWCAASEKYDLAFLLLDDQVVAPTATAVFDECHRPKETEPPKATATPTLSTETVVTPETEVTPTPPGNAPTSEPTTIPTSSG